MKKVRKYEVYRIDKTIFSFRFNFVKCSHGDEHLKELGFVAKQFTDKQGLTTLYQPKYFKNRVTLDINPDRKGISFEIKSFSEKDVGNWVCQISQLDGLDEDDTFYLSFTAILTDMPKNVESKFDCPLNKTINFNHLEDEIGGRKSTRKTEL